MHMHYFSFVCLSLICYIHYALGFIFAVRSFICMTCIFSWREQVSVLDLTLFLMATGFSARHFTATCACLWWLPSYPWETPTRQWALHFRPVPRGFNYYYISLRMATSLFSWFLNEYMSEIFNEYFWIPVFCFFSLSSALDCDLVKDSRMHKVPPLSSGSCRVVWRNT